MKNKHLKRLISIIFIVLFMLILPVSGFYQGHNYFVYAGTLDIIKSASEMIVPAAGLVAYQYNNASQTINSADLSSYIDKAKTFVNTSFDNFADDTKLALAYVTTVYSLSDINAILGTSYSQNTVDSMQLDSLRLKIENGQQLTLWDMQRLGINDIAAKVIKSNIGQNAITNGEIININGVNTTLNTISSTDYYVKAFNADDLIVNLFPVTVNSTSTMNHFQSSTWKNFIETHQTYVFEVSGELYKIQWDVRYEKPSLSTVNPPTRILGNYAPYGAEDHLYLYDMVGGNWNIVYHNDVSGDPNTSFINALKTYTGIDLTTSSRYGESLYKAFPPTWVGKGVNFGNYSKDYTVSGLTGEVLSSYSGADTSITQAEKVIQDITAQGENAQSFPYEVTSYPNSVTGEEEVILTPTGVDGIPASDTGSENIDYPDTSGDLGDGSLNIPILGSILAWLKKIWQMIKDLYDLILNHFMNPTGVDEGIDWGNFKGFFDIFYIFYYLIIIVILILLKFLAAVMNMMSIPANTALFDSYPTMLSGLNYIKGIKVGGFSITLQQIFDYMFTVFFFLFVVTVLQKLYHSFSSVERQQSREDREIKYKNSDYENIHYEDRR